MQIVRRLSDLAVLREEWRAAGETVALVPTMGALHDGHLGLVAAAREVGDRVMATIFVNPAQFNDASDLERYPRAEAEDVAKLEAAACDAVWIPAVEDIYPQGFATRVSVRGVSERWEGEHRPGHFDGVATVVAKLFVAVMPEHALFGEKDWQQLAVIRRMTADLGLPVRVHGHVTVREPSGLALSSRNALLSREDLQAAEALPATLQRAARAIGEGGEVGAVLAKARGALEQAGFGPINYLAYVDGATMEPLDTRTDEGRLIVAAFLGKVRLIDNMRVPTATV